MNVDFSKFVNKNDIIAVALSGGGDSMALIHALKSQSTNLGIKVIALNVEHGIRGDNSISDSKFVKDYCEKYGIELLSYSVDSIKKAKDEKLSIEQSARALRYECFYNAISNKKCDKIATAHHLSDNTESVLLNLFRGTGLKGISGIQENYQDKIIRPLLSVTKSEIENYLSKNKIPFITDETNFSDEYTRNYLRLNIIPEIKKIFPEAEKSIERFSEIVKTDDDFIQQTAKSSVNFILDKAEIKLPLHRAVFSRATILAMQYLGIEKDWEKSHIDSVFSLCDKETGSMINLPKGVVAIKEYDKVVVYKKQEISAESIPFFIGTKMFLNKKITIEEFSSMGIDVKSGLFGDVNKIPQNAIIRTKKDGDVFTKFGGGTKSLGDYMTDKKIPLRVRNEIPLLAVENDILVIFGVAVSDKVKADNTTTNLIKFNLL
ncbi:MAG: tRNA lysidine(34) synthetase TilS [Clostridia bacterium]|nr:tRNA lysidine(34) synthetase TilS [Clostridia bacterium]